MYLSGLKRCFGKTFGAWVAAAISTALRKRPASNRVEKAKENNDSFVFPTN